MTHLNNIDPLKTKCVRANNAPFMNKTLSKAIMTRSRLKTKYNYNPNILNQSNYEKYRNYCVNLFRWENKKYYDHLNTNLITDNKKFWKTVKPLFSDKHKSNKKITLVEKDEIISNDIEVAEVMNTFSSESVII